MILRRRLTLLIAPILVAAMLVAACGGGDDPTPTATPGSLLPTASPTPTATPDVPLVSPYSLPTRDVPFAVDLPAGTSGPVFVRIFGVTETDFARSAELTQQSDGSWTASVPLEEGALVRYAYDRGDIDDLASLIARREAPAVGLETTWRIVHVAPELTEIRDTVEMWANAPAAAPSGTVTGVVTDAVSGEPVMDAEVSVAGMHTATDYDGRYRIENVAAGAHHVTVHRATGDYLAQSQSISVAAGSEASAAFEVMPARPLTVQIQVILPEDMPADAVVKIYGNAWQLGGEFFAAPGQPTGLRLPIARPVRGTEGERVQIALDLHEGQPVSYRYTLAGPGLSAEQTAGGDQTARSFIASRQNRVRVDEVEGFRPDGAVEMVLRVDVPDNTPANTPLQFVNGPSHWLNAGDDGSWSTVLYGRPGEQLSYALRLGESVTAGADASADAPNGTRTLEVPEADAAVDVEVTDWVGLRGVPRLGDDELAEVTFRISVPAGTIDSSTLRLTGDRDLADGIELSSAPGDPTLFEGTAMLPAGRYTYQIWREDPSGASEPVRSAFDRELEVEFARETVNGWVAGWGGEIPNIRPRDTTFVGGYYLPDFWSPGFAAVTRPTVESIEERAWGPVVLSSVWSYGEVRPEPVVEPRPLLAGSVATPLAALEDQAAEARRSGLPVVLAPQFNYELTPSGSSIGGPKTQQWIDGWLREAERLWLWNAEAANAINADVLLLPGPTFHVFDPASFFPSQASFEEFDAALVNLVAEVRERYHGKVLISGSQTGLEAPGSADFVGVTSFDIGNPGLGPAATVEQWRAAYDARFAAVLDPIYEAYELPVVIYQLRVPARPSAGDPTGEYAQARQLEGMLQALSQRTYVTGAYSWAYEMIGAPELAEDSVRGRLAEAVLLKHYSLFNPADISAVTIG